MRLLCKYFSLATVSHICYTIATSLKVARQMKSKSADWSAGGRCSLQRTHHSSIRYGRKLEKLQRRQNQKIKI